MYIKLLMRLIFGYLRIEVEGYYIERFINICTNNKILIWNLKREKGVKLFLNIGIKDFKNIKEICKKTNCKAKILKKKGIPFLIHRYKKRKIFGIFLILMLIAIFISSKYIWNIDINVKDDLILENIEGDIENLGIKKGVRKDKIDKNRIINELRLKRNDIAWVGIDIEGTTAKIDIAKADESPNIIDNSKSCDIVASKAGTITKITAQNGTAVVNVGDNVNKGDVLIAGYMEGKYTDTRMVHSLGEVEAIVSYQMSKELKFEQDVYYQTGNEENKYEIYFNNFRIKLYKNESKFFEYSKQVENKNLRVFGNFYLPISIVKINNKEQIKEKKNYTLDEIVKMATDDVSFQIEDKIKDKDKIKDRKVEVKEESDGAIITVIYEVQEDIGESRY